MEEILIIILQFLIETILEVFVNTGLDSLFWNRDTPESEKVGIVRFWWFLGGCFVACISLLIINHTLISLPALRIVNLVAAPIISAEISGRISEKRAKLNPNIIPRNHYWQAFWFTLGLVLIRFVYVSRF